MEIRLIKTFQTIVKLGNFQRAAEALQYSQPTITIQIKKLEEELGVKLFERGKTITLTSAGRVLLERADSLLKEYDVLNGALSDFIQGDAGVVRVGASEPSASNRLPAVLAEFKSSKPKVQIHVTISTTKELMRMLVEDQIDFALCNQPEPHLELEFHPLIREKFALLLPDDHPLAERDDIRLKDLKDEKFLFTPGTCPFRIRIEEMITRSIGKLRHNGMEVAGITAIKYFVQARLGIALAPIVAISPAIPGTVVKPIADMLDGPELGLLTRRNASGSKISEYLLDEIKQTLRVRA
ncbi:LysR family transcriptional regulator [Paenibacillus hemerocallicola]|uniref:LysR family transcriptional regulator n=1 Tax=Paenibacillus hemerocallicola TaxID=1172614 RepID=A0A5C4SZ78_9BACL|nr:LysR family transcriptional regulator [Paenibacillus hemerocallicola]TNJ61983.1 LysR family transcriptional regulator [Paenibacillus hemerocallicola]